MAGGLLSGYRFESIRVCGLLLHKNEKNFCCVPCKLTPIGQCIMLPNRGDCKAGVMLAGGLTANMAAAIISGLIFALFDEGEFVFWRLTVFIFIPANILMGAACLIPEGGNDMYTLLELKAFPERHDIYHRLLSIEAANGRGIPLYLMPAEYFSVEGYDDICADEYTDKASLTYEMMCLKAEYEKAVVHSSRYLSENIKDNEDF